MTTTPDRLLRRLEWHVVRRLDGQLQGPYRTVHRGAGIDFPGLREYTPEDDVRHMDWNVTARLDEPYIPVRKLARVASEIASARERTTRICARLGPDQYQVRRYDAWCRYVTLCLVAGGYLALGG